MILIQKLKPLIVGLIVGTLISMIIFPVLLTDGSRDSTNNEVLPDQLSKQNQQTNNFYTGLGLHLVGGFQPSEKIIIATAACSKNKNTSIYEETAVMMKSVLISAKMNMVDQVEFHVFLEYKSSVQFFSDKLQEFGIPNENMNVQVYLYSAVQTVPIKYHRHMIYHRRFRCGYVRTFFPSALPNVDSVIYLDTDVIVTGDIRRLWQQFKLMNPQQMVAIGRNNEPEDTNYKEMDLRHFGDIPHVPPKGLNNGVIAMNLTRLREFGWEEKFCKLYDIYAQSVKVTVQRLMNILLFYNPALLLIIPCELHFIHTHCTKGPTCQNVETDPIGIHLLHGANNTFEPGRIFRKIFETYQKFNMTKDDFYFNLVKPIKQNYEKIQNDSKCYGYLAENLYKHVQ